VDRAAWLWCDLDGGNEGPEGAARLLRESGLPEPDIIVASGNGIHCYWQLSGAVPLTDQSERDRFECVLKRVVKKIGGTAPGPHADSSRADLASVLRPPGTVNHKYS